MTESLNRTAFDTNWLKDVSIKLYCHVWLSFVELGEFHGNKSDHVYKQLLLISSQYLRQSLYTLWDFQCICPFLFKVSCSWRKYTKWDEYVSVISDFKKVDFSKDDSLSRENVIPSERNYLLKSATVKASHLKMKIFSRWLSFSPRWLGRERKKRPMQVRWAYVGAI